jgi:hypothetical protein
MMCANKKYMQHFLLFQLVIIIMSNILSYISSFLFTKQKQEDLIPPNTCNYDISNKENINSYNETYDETYDTFDCDGSNVFKTSRIKKSSSFSNLPKTRNPAPQSQLRNNQNNKYSDYSKYNQCFNCKSNIYTNCKQSYHAYDNVWCYNCWAKLDINNV